MKIDLRLMGILLLLCFYGNGFAANVEWNTAFVVYEGKDWSVQNRERYTMGMPYLVMFADSISGGVALSASPDSNLANANTFAVAHNGDTVSSDYMAKQSLYFAYAKYGNPGSEHADYTVFLNGDERIYLAYENVSADAIFYGWVELGLNEHGILEAFSSARGQDGGPLVVGLLPGSTPEPSGGMLLLVGVFISLLKRPRQSRHRCGSGCRFYLFGRDGARPSLKIRGLSPRNQGSVPTKSCR